MEKQKGFLSGLRLAIGIVSIVLFALITFQSCAAGIVNTLEENGEVSGTAGFMLAICMLVAGIVGIVTRNAVKKGGVIVTAVFYLVGALIAISNVGSYSDLAIWATLAAIFGLIHIICAIKTKKQ